MEDVEISEVAEAAEAAELPIYGEHCLRELRAPWFSSERPNGFLDAPPPLGFRKLHPRRPEVCDFLTPAEAPESMW